MARGALGILLSCCAVHVNRAAAIKHNTLGISPLLEAASRVPDRRLQAAASMPGRWQRPSLRRCGRSWSCSGRSSSATRTCGASQVPLAPQRALALALALALNRRPYTTKVGLLNSDMSCAVADTIAMSYLGRCWCCWHTLTIW